MRGPVRVALVGCGNIAGPYARSLAAASEVQLVAVTDLERPRAEALATEVGCAVHEDLPSLLADERVELVVNLSIHSAHHAVTKACLEAGRHVYSEKPLAMTPEEANALVELARARGVRLGCSPFTFMGEAQQEAWRVVRSGRLGRVRVAYAEVNWGRIESWHPTPASFYEVGALFDVGVYPLTILTAFFGPARRVLAYGTVLHPERATKSGEPLRITTPDFVVAVVELEGGVVARLTTNFYVSQSTKQAGIEFHGDDGSLHLRSWQDPDSALEFAPFGRPYEPLPSFPDTRMEWGLGVREMAQAIREERPHRATGEQAAHVVEILAAAARSLQEHAPVVVGSSFEPPAPFQSAVAPSPAPRP
jgi:predicted dehydrogenase